jgi:hypothetical protein
MGLIMNPRHLLYMVNITLVLALAGMFGPNWLAVGVTVVACCGLALGVAMVVVSACGGRRNEE